MDAPDAHVGAASLPVWRIAGLARAGLAAVLTFCAVASHGLIDAFTDGGLGIALFAPFTDARYFSPFRPLMASPLSARAFFTSRGLSILGNELLWIGPVALIVGLASWWARCRASRRS